MEIANFWRGNAVLVVHAGFILAMRRQVSKVRSLLMFLGVDAWLHLCGVRLFPQLVSLRAR